MGQTAPPETFLGNLAEVPTHPGPTEFPLQTDFSNQQLNINMTPSFIALPLAIRF